MIKASLEIFVQSVMAAGEITLADVRVLQRDVLPDGVWDRDEADTLIALDRAVASKHCSWSAFAIQAVVDFVVWTSRPTGYVDGETARWLVASLSAGSGPSAVAQAIAFDVVREAERADEALLAFVMRSAGGRILEVIPDVLAA
jgi:hypothetical protein